nr:SDR family NAD(P)-dependent oxidoreductase [Pseudenhygromyxa sp. WMMC2535]
MACRLPGARDYASFWSLLAGGRRGITRVPRARWHWERFYAEDPSAKNKAVTAEAGFLDDIARFDNEFFKLTPREAALMDPQQRLLLELTWAALEDAGIRPSSLDGERVGVFVGSSSYDYKELYDRYGEQVEGHAITGTANAILANRVSNFFNFRGPSVSVDTACASGLSALHVGLSALLDGSCSVCVVGGVNLLCAPERMIPLSKLGMLSPRGELRAFDAEADGYVRGEGVGVVVLQRLGAAQAEGRVAHGLLRAMASGHGGRARTLTSPNAFAQAQVITDAIVRAGVGPETITYIEAHGTGTPLGDPIEIHGLHRGFSRAYDALGSQRPAGPHVAVGSAKPNIGHLEGAAGMAGLIKVLLSFRHGQLAPLASLERVNPRVKLDKGGFYLVDSLRDWRPVDAQGEPIPRRAGVSSFGFGGSNTHAVLEEGPREVREAPEPSPLAFPISAREGAALSRMVARLRAAVAVVGEGELRLDDVAFTLQRGRDSLAARAVVLASTRASLLEGLDLLARAEDPSGRTVATDAREELVALAQRWLEAGSVDWGAASPGEAARATRLPTYPFAGPRHWLPGIDADALTGPVARRHGLGFGGEAWAVVGPQGEALRELSTVVRPGDPLIAGHEVGGTRWLPGVVTLELLRAAAASLGGPGWLGELRWLRPLAFGEAPRELRVRMSEDGELSLFAEGEQAYARARWVEGPPGCAGEADELGGALAGVPQRTIEGETYYAELSARGLEYGPRLRAVQRLSVAEGEALAELESTAEVVTGLEPSLLDGMLQLAAALVDVGEGVPVPASLEAVVWSRALPRRGRALARRRSDGALDMALYAEGEVEPRLRLRGLRVSAVAHDAPAVGYRPSWRALAIEHEGQATTSAPPRALIIPGAHEDLGERAWLDALGIAAETATTASALEEALPEALDELLLVLPKAGASVPGERLERAFELVSALAAAGRFDRGASLLAITWGGCAPTPAERRRGSDPDAAGVHALLRSLEREHPKLRLRALDLPGASSGAPSEAELAALRAWMGDAELGREARVLGLRGGRLLARVLVPRVLPIEAAQPGLRAGGHFLIVGGARGIGLETAVWLATELGAKLSLVGRRPLDAGMRAAFDRIEAAGGQWTYLAADLCDAQGLARALDQARARFGAIHGAIHSALVLRDQRVATMDRAGFAAALAPKLAGTRNLVEALAEDPLELLLAYSSVVSLRGNAGQANYAAGCAAQEAYLEGVRARAGGRVHVQVINWGYWSEVGSVAGPKYAAHMRAAGIRGIDVRAGISALAGALASACPQLAVLAAADEALASFGVVLGRSARAQRGSAPAWGELSRELPALAKARFEREADDFAQAAQGFDALERWALAQAQARRFSLRPRAAVDRRFTPLLRALDALADTEAVAGGEALEIDALIAQNPALTSHAELLRACVEGLPQVLAGELEAVELMFSPKLREHVAGVYANTPIADFYNELVASSVERFVAHRRAAGATTLRILEVGAGTGGTSARVLERLAQVGEGLALEYVFSDVSPAFVRAAKQRFGSHDFVRFAQLDLESEAQMEALPGCGSYDLVIAANVVHATRDLERTLDNIARAVARHGCLILSEACALQVFTTLSFGLLEGWWLAEDGHRRLAHAPLLEPQGWCELLGELGFRAVALTAPEGAPAHPRQCVVVAESSGAYTVRAQVEVAAEVEVREEIGAGEREVVVGLRARRPAARPSSEDGVERGAWLRGRITAQLAKVTGLSAAGIDVDRSFSESGVDSLLAVELINAIGDELGITLRTTVLFDRPTIRELASHLVEAHAEAVDAAFAAAGGGAPAPKLEPEPEPKPDPRSAPAREQAPAIEQAPAREQAQAIDLDLDRAGLVLRRAEQLEDVALAPLAPRRPGPNEVRIEVHAASLNFGDLLCVRGLYPSMPEYPFTPGFEVAGVVAELGEGVRGLAIGDAVIAVTGAELGGHASSVTTPAEFVVAKPRSLCFAQACALPVVFATADEALRRAQLSAGERVLIQTAAGGVGLLAIQLAQARGAEIFATAGSARKCEHLRGLGVEHVINYRERDFAEAVMAASAGEGVDVVLNTLAGDALQKGLGCLRAGGRYVEIAMTGLRSARAVDLSGLFDNQSFISIDLRRSWLRDPSRAQRSLARMVEAVAGGQIEATIARRFPFADIAQAYAYLAGAHNIGKVVVTRARPRAPATARTVGAARAASPRAGAGPVAIVGMAGRYPGAADLDAFWRNLEAGRCDLREVDESRWSPGACFDSDRSKAGTTYGKWGGFLDGIDRFDSLFFNISGREAERMDPQQRLFLEQAYRAIEDAGLRPEQLAGEACGVFLGGGSGDYSERLRAAGVATEGYEFMGNEASICAARIAYHLNLRGPSLAISTACSSSLVATHYACQSIAAGECELALAGGVFINTTPRFFVLCSQAGMLSPTGRMRPFDAEADGFVPGEGVGVVVLASLERALAERLPIHGVILGSAVNQDGRTNGITAPSADSQARLMRELYARAGVEPESLSYVECHGTGTPLGDPIEFEALTRVFGPRGSGADARLCSLGSVKANIGHAVTAAGVAGVHKLLLALRHRRLPPLVGHDRLNPRLVMEDGRFCFDSAARAWIDEDGPLRGAVSSFGFSGTNAHLVIEEAPAPLETARPRAGAWLVVLSAATPEALERRLVDLAAWVEAHRGDDLHPADLCGTLLAGRAHLEHRAAVVIDAVEALPAALRSSSWRPAAGDGASIGGWKGEVLSKEGAPADEPLQKIFARVRGGEPGTRRELERLAAAFVAGVALPWAQLPAAAGFRRLSLPSYPFAGPRHWPEEASPQRAGYPLAPSDPWLRDHVVHGRAIVPAALGIELIRAAAGGAGAVRALRGLRWERAIEVAAGGELRVELEPSSTSVARSVAGSGPGSEMRCSLSASGEGGAPALTARVVLGEAQPGPRPRIELDVLRARCRARVSGAECRRRLRAIGLVHGPAYESVEAAEVGEGEALAYLVRPAAARPGEAASRLGIADPSVLDGAWQVIVTLLDEGAGATRRLAPRSLDSLRWLAPLPERCIAHVRARAGGYDVRLADEAGRVCVIAEGLGLDGSRRAVASEGELLTLAPWWRELPELPEVVGQAGAPASICALELGAQARALAPLGEALRGLTRERGFGSRVELSASISGLADAELLLLSYCGGGGEDGAREAVSEALAELARTLPALAAKLSARGLERRQRAVVIVEVDTLIGAALPAALRSLADELPGLALTILRVEAGDTASARARAILAIASAGGALPPELSLDRGRLRALAAREQALPVSAPRPWRAGGVYWITGGAGGIGRALVADVLAVPGTQVVVIGRSGSEGAPRDDAGRVHDERADLRERAEVEALVARARARGLAPTGIVHLAGVLADGALAAQSPHAFSQAAAAKLLGAVYLDEALAEAELELFAVFSSLAGCFGNAGQASYALANRGLHTFAARRERLRATGQRRGQTRAIAWGQWADGGFALSEAAAARLARVGLEPMPAALGLDALARVIAAPEPVYFVAHGARTRLAAFFAAGSEALAAEAPVSRTSSPAPTGAPSLDEVRGHFAGFLASALKVPRSRIHADESLDRLGLDSIIVAKLTAELERDFGPLPKTLFFEHKTLGELADYFVAHAPEALANLLGARPETELEAETAASRRGVGVLGGPGREQGEAPTARARQVGSAAGEVAVQGVEAIAVIGLAARFPDAPDYRALWRNLCAGKDSVRPIPPSRWSTSGEPAAREAGGFIDDADSFDALFFNISPREAARMDPQERCFLEAAWSTLEDAGYTRRALRERHAGKLGVFVGVMWGDYQLYGAEDPGQPRVESSYASIANRVSFFLDASGPSLAIDSMCSSSLSALHFACDSLRSGQCALALAGGVNLSLHPAKYRYLEQERFLAEDGRCRSFGAGGSGYVPSEGVGAVLLKPLAQALADGDPIRAVIRGSALNHGGRTYGYTVPNPKAQAEVIREALARSGVAGSTIGYIEAHGTGTSLGDPIEVRGLDMAFGALADGEPRALGSIKSNIGHAESAAGVAALAKVILQLEHRTLVPSLHAEQINPNIDFERSSFRLQRERGPWPAPRRGGPRRAGISSFGAGGANAHVIVEEWRASAELEVGAGAGAQLIVLSAKSGERLGRVAAGLLAKLEADAGAGAPLELAALAHTLQVGRERLEVRAAFVADGRAAVLDGLRALVDGLEREGGRGLAGASIAFASALDDADGQPRPSSASVLAALEAGELELAAQRWVRAEDEPELAPWWRGRGRRIPLPTYPFRRDRHWLPERPAAGRVASERAAPGRAEVEPRAEAEQRAAEQPTGAGPAPADKADVVSIIAALKRGSIDVAQATRALAGGSAALAVARAIGRAPARGPAIVSEGRAAAKPGKTAIIGGGPWGIALGKNLAERGLDFEILEREQDFGGVWNFGSGAGRVYEQTHLISSKLNTQFSDVPMPADYPAYPNHRQFLAYLRDVARRFGLYANARFGAGVEAATPEGEGKGEGWRVRTTDGEERRYANLIVATGMQRKPLWPSYPGSFAGEVLHSASYRDAGIFRGKRALIVGGGNSGCDIAVDATSCAERVLHSTRRAYHYMPKFIDGLPTQEWLMKLPRQFPERKALWAHVERVFKLAGYDPADYGLPRPKHALDEAHPIMNSRLLYHVGHGDIIPKRDVVELAGERVRFSDGSEERVDLIVYACGYELEFPFLAPGSVPFVGPRPDLQLRMLHRERDNLAFVGFLNAAGGLGNVANAVGRFMASYLDGLARGSAAVRALRARAHEVDAELELDRFVDSSRHAFEVDLWAYVKLLNRLQSELRAGDEARAARAGGSALPGKATVLHPS